MDCVLLNFFNKTLAHPILDSLMLGVTWGGLALIPILGIVLWTLHQHRPALAIFVAATCALLATFAFQFVAQRPRPAHVRLLTAPPDYPSYPSGHAALAFGAAAVLCLTYRQLHWIWLTLAGASLITISRIYLGIHYPSDVIGGAIIGAAAGAACYGLLVLENPDSPGWIWLLWPQVALIFIATQMAYLNILPQHLLSWPFADKVLHFVLFGAVVFWLNLWLKGRMVSLWHWQAPLAVLILFTIALLEEAAQALSPFRTVDAIDLTCDLAGMLFFRHLSEIVIKRKTLREE